MIHLLKSSPKFASISKLEGWKLKQEKKEVKVREWEGGKKGLWINHKVLAYNYMDILKADYMDGNKMSVDKNWIMYGW